MTGYKPVVIHGDCNFYGVYCVCEDDYMCDMITILNDIGVDRDIPWRARICEYVRHGAQLCPDCDWVSGMELFYNTYCVPREDKPHGRFKPTPVDDH